MRLFLVALLGSAAMLGQVAPATDDPQTGVIAGKVMNVQTGESIAGATVRLVTFSSQPSQSGRPAVSRQPTTTTQADGSFRFEGLASGMYFLSGEAAGFVRQSRAVQRGTDRSAGPFALERGQQIINRTVPLTPQGMVSGKVVDENDRPVAGVAVQAFAEGVLRGKTFLTPQSRATSNAAGEFRINKLDGGTYYLAADPPPPTTRAGQSAPDETKATVLEPATAEAPPQSHIEIIRTYYPASITPAGAGKVQVQAGQETTAQNIRIQKADTFHIRGKVAGVPQAATVQKLQIYVSSQGPVLQRGLARSVAVSADGSFDMAGLPQGGYTLQLVEASGRQRRRLLAQQDVDLAGTDLTGVVLSAPPPIVITGDIRVEELDSANLAGVRVSAIPGDPTGFGGLSDAQLSADRTFQLENLDPSRYILRVSGNPPGSYIKTVTYNQQDVLGKLLDLARLGSGQLEITLRPGAAQIDATIDGQVQAPLTTGVLIPATLREDGSGSVYAEMAGTTFSFRNVSPGRYYAYAVEQFDYAAWQVPEFLQQIQTQGVVVEVSESDHKQLQIPRISRDRVQQVMAQLGIEP